MRLSSLLVLFAAGCGGAMAQRSGPTGGLKLRCLPPDAAVYVDEEYRGACRLFEAHALPLAAGEHLLQVEAGGYFPYYGELDTGGIVQTLEVGLVRRPD